MKTEKLLQEIIENPAVLLSEMADKCGLHSRNTDCLINSISTRPDRKQRIKSFLRINGKKIADYSQSKIPLQVPSDADDIGGEIIIGKELHTGRPVGVNLAELTRPAAVFGATGFYKTITMSNMAVPLIEHGIPLIIIDRKGRQFRALQQLFPRKVLVKQADGDFPYNPYSIDSPDYQTRLVEMRSEIFERKDSSSIFLEVLETESRNCTVCEHSLHNAVLNLKFRRGFSGMRKLQQSLLAVSTGLVSGSFGNTLAYIKGIDLKEMIKQKISIVIECPNASLIQAEFLITALINECQYHLRNQGLQQDKLQVMFMIDEASELFRERDGIPPVIELATKIRQSGTGLLVGMHAPHLAHSMLMANLHVALIYRVTSGISALTLKKSYSLSDEIAEYIPKQQLSQGIAILGDRYSKPLGFQSLEPIAGMDLNIPADFVKENNKEIMSGLPEIVPWKGKLLFVIIPREITAPESREEMQGDAMGEKEKVFLDYILHRFDLPLTEVYRELGFSMQEGDRISDSITKKNLAVPVWLNPSGGKGGLCKFFSHTEKYFTLTGMERPVAGTDGKGAEHSLMLRFALKDLGKKECREILVSRQFSGAVCDIYFRNNGCAYVAEICSTTIKTEQAKLAKILGDSDVAFAFVIVKDNGSLQAVSREFAGSDIKDRVVICRMSDFLNSRIEELTQKGGA